MARAPGRRLDIERGNGNAGMPLPHSGDGGSEGIGIVLLRCRPPYGGLWFEFEASSSLFPVACKNGRSEPC